MAWGVVLNSMWAPILMPAALTAAAFGQGPADLEAVSVLVAFIPGDLHAGGQVDLDGDRAMAPP